jgi:hypothetical protein
MREKEIRGGKRGSFYRIFLGSKRDLGVGKENLPILAMEIQLCWVEFDTINVCCVLVMKVVYL